MPGTSEWGPPISVGCGGAGGGFDFGFSKSYQIIVLNTDEVRYGRGRARRALMVTVEGITGVHVVMGAQVM